MTEPVDRTTQGSKCGDVMPTSNASLEVWKRVVGLRRGRCRRSTESTRASLGVVGVCRIVPATSVVFSRWRSSSS